jgi:hypothetical protein
MSVDAMKWVWRIADLDRIPTGCGGQFAVLIVLSDHASNQDDEDWVAFPSVEKIARRTRQSEKSVLRHLQWLIAEGWISRATRGVRKLGKGKFVYVLERDRLEVSPDNMSGEKVGCSGDKLSGESGAISPDNMSGEAGDVHRTSCPALPDNLSGFTGQSVQSPTPPNIAELPMNSHSTGVREREDEAFDRVEKAWGEAAKNAVGRRPDRQAWDKALGKVSAARLEPACLRYLAYCASTGSRVFSLARWLGDEKWEPFLEAPAPIAVAADPAFRAPADVIAVLAGNRQKDWIAYLTGCAWDDAERAILVRTRMAADALRNHFAADFDRLGVQIIVRKPA